MSTATEERKPPVKFKRLRLPVSFGSVSIGDEIASVAITLTHEALTATDGDHPVLRAYEVLCSRRLKVILTLGRRNDGETQGKLMETDVTITGTCDTNPLRVTRKGFGNKLSFDLSEVHANQIAEFAKREGYLTITSLMEQIDLGDDDGTEEGEEETEGGARKKTK